MTVPVLEMVTHLLNRLTDSVRRQFPDVVVYFQQEILFHVLE